MKKNIIILMIVAFFFCAPLPRTYGPVCNNQEHSQECKVARTLKMAIAPFRKKESIINKLSFEQPVTEQIRPSLHIKYKNVVSRVKFRPQSARMVVDDAQNFILIKTNTCSIIRTRNFVKC